jgi:hypothetical protein
MPLKIASSDRRLLLWAGSVMVLIIVALAMTSADQQESEIPSSYSSDSHGAKAAYLLLLEQGYNIERWEQSPSELPRNPAGTVLVLASPFNTPTRDEKNSLQSFLAAGGKILATGSNAGFFLPQAETVPELLTGSEWKEFKPQLLTPLTRGGPIRMAPAAYWKQNAPPLLAHYTDGDRPVVVSYKVGKGEVIWWASTTPLNNAGITAAGNLQLLLNSVGESRDVRILWDEYFHGYRNSLGAYVGRTPLKYGLLQCFLLLGAVLFTYSRRSLPIRSQAEKSRLSPLEFVETLGGLYRRAKANRAALQVPYNRFRLLAARRLGLRTDIPAENLVRSLRSRLGDKDDGLSELLRRIESALAQDDLAEATVLNLAQELNLQVHKLKLLQENFTNAERVRGAQARAK